MRQQGAGVGAFDGRECGFECGGRAVADDVGQKGVDNLPRLGRVQQLQLQKLAHIFRIVLREERQHFV